ncbi:MAG: hypothetical protein EOM37_08815 [Proteobacteria bacterium]|nr:hypothetical protein [Pseudomonadota bacterium]
MSLLMTNVTYSHGELVPRLSASQRDADMKFVSRQIKHWTSNDLLRPVGDKHTGMGRSRQYPEQEIIVAAYLHELSKYGVTIGNLKGFRKFFDNCMKNPDSANALMGKTNKQGYGGYIVYLGLSDKPNKAAGYKIIPIGTVSGDDIFLTDVNTDKDMKHLSGLIINCADVVARLNLP